MQCDFGAAHTTHLVLVVFGAAELADDFSKHIVLAGADVRKVRDDELVYGEDVGQFDVERRLGACVEVIEFVNVELCFGFSDVDYWKCQ